MKSTPLLATLVLLCAITALALVGITATTDGDATPVLLPLIGLMSPTILGVMGLLKQQLTLDVSKNTDAKVDALVKDMAEIKEVIAVLRKVNP